MLARVPKFGHPGRFPQAGKSWNLDGKVSIGLGIDYCEFFRQV
jgi:hypothetical protein